MTTPTIEQIRAIRALGDAIVEAVAAAGPMGAPSGHLYAALMGKISLEAYERFMSSLVSTGRIRQRGLLYFAVETSHADR